MAEYPLPINTQQAIFNSANYITLDDTLTIREGDTRYVQIEGGGGGGGQTIYGNLVVTGTETDAGSKTLGTKRAYEYIVTDTTPTDQATIGIDGSDNLVLNAAVKIAKTGGNITTSTGTITCYDLDVTNAATLPSFSVTTMTASTYTGTSMNLSGTMSAAGISSSVGYTASGTTTNTFAGPLTLSGSGTSGILTAPSLSATSAAFSGTTGTQGLAYLGTYSSGYPFAIGESGGNLLFTRNGYDDLNVNGSTGIVTAGSLISTGTLSAAGVSSTSSSLTNTFAGPVTLSGSGTSGVLSAPSLSGTIGSFSGTMSAAGITSTGTMTCGSNLFTCGAMTCSGTANIGGNMTCAALTSSSTTTSTFGGPVTLGGVGANSQLNTSYLDVTTSATIGNIVGGVTIGSVNVSGTLSAHGITSAGTTTSTFNGPVTLAGALTNGLLTCPELDVTGSATLPTLSSLAVTALSGTSAAFSGTASAAGITSSAGYTASGTTSNTFAGPLTLSGSGTSGFLTSSYVSDTTNVHWNSDILGRFWQPNTNNAIHYILVATSIAVTNYSTPPLTLSGAFMINSQADNPALNHVINFNTSLGYYTDNGSTPTAILSPMGFLSSDSPILSTNTSLSANQASMDFAVYSHSGLYYVYMVGKISNGNVALGFDFNVKGGYSQWTIASPTVTDVTSPVSGGTFLFNLFDQTLQKVEGTVVNFYKPNLSGTPGAGTVEAYLDASAGALSCTAITSSGNISTSTGTITCYNLDVTNAATIPSFSVTSMAASGTMSAAGITSSAGYTASGTTTNTFAGPLTLSGSGTAGALSCTTITSSGNLTCTGIISAAATYTSSSCNFGSSTVIFDFTGFTTGTYFVTVVPNPTAASQTCCYIIYVGGGTTAVPQILGQGSTTVTGVGPGTGYQVVATNGYASSPVIFDTNVILLGLV